MPGRIVEIKNTSYTWNSQKDNPITRSMRDEGYTDSHNPLVEDNCIIFNRYYENADAWIRIRHYMSKELSNKIKKIKDNGSNEPFSITFYSEDAWTTHRGSAELGR